MNNEVWGDEEPESWWYKQLELQFDNEVVSLTGAQWFDIITLEPVLVNELFGVDPIDILHMLDSEYELWS